MQHYSALRLDKWIITQPWVRIYLLTKAAQTNISATKWMNFEKNEQTTNKTNPQMALNFWTLLNFILA